MPLSHHTFIIYAQTHLFIEKEVGKSSKLHDFFDFINYYENTYTHHTKTLSLSVFTYSVFPTIIHLSSPTYFLFPMRKFNSVIPPYFMCILCFFTNSLFSIFKINMWKYFFSGQSGMKPSTDP